MMHMQDLNIMLSQMPFPAFLVLDGKICLVNQAAAQRTAEVGCPVSDILVTGQEEYLAFTQGSLSLRVQFSGTQYTCYVTQLHNYQLFTMESDTANQELNALALASTQLYLPLSEITLILDRLSGNSEDKSKITKNLQRLQRTVRNMADAGQFVSSSPKMATCEMCMLLKEVFDKVSDALLKAGVTLRYTLPRLPVFTQADSQMIKRAVYNLISNAVKFASEDKTVDICVSATDRCLYIAVANANVAEPLPGGIFHRYSRQPGLEPQPYGLGLGMTFIQAAAAAHGGTVLVQNNEQAGLTVTMSLAINKAKDNQLKSPVLIPDLYGGADQMLIELSDILPYQLYND